MPLINLIHEQRLQVRQQERKVRVLMLATVGLGAIAFLGAGYFLFETARYQLMVGGLEAKKRALEPLLKQLKSNELDERLLEPKLTTLTSATKATEQWSRIMNHLTINVPKGVWLNSVKCVTQTDAEGGVTLTFTGYSVNHDGIGELLLRLDKCTDLEGVTLKFSQERVLEKEAKVLEFEISATLAGSKVEKKIKEKDAV